MVWFQQAMIVYLNCQVIYKLTFLHDIEVFYRTSS